MWQSFIDGVISSLPSFLNVSDEKTFLHALAIFMLVNGIAAFVALALFRVEAPYGKYAEKAAWFYGPPINGKVAWILQETPSFAVPALYWLTQAASGGANAAELGGVNPRTVLLSMLLLHYLNRSFIFPLRIKGGKPTPLVIMLMALAFCLVNGYLQGAYLTKFATEQGSDLLHPRFVLGFVLWLAGLFINLQADDILRNLRKPGETGYKIPRGGMFDYVSGANFFGEIVEWAGWALAAGSLPAAAFAAFTFLNIGPRGLQHHMWYLEKFKGEYPSERKAVIPFVW